MKAVADAATIDEYLARVSEPARATLNKVRAMIRAAAPPEAAEAIIYRIPAFRYAGKPLFGFAAFARHCSLFPMSAGVIKGFPAELAKYQTSKGTIQFAVDKAPPAALVKKLVRARVAEIESGGKKKRG